MNNTDPLISVVIITYNNESYIEQCVNSALNQTFDDYEIIVVNDGSTDGTQAVVERIESGNARIRSYSKTNGGIVSARIEGVIHSRGKYITFIDGDDWIGEDYLSNLMSYTALTCDSECIPDIVVANVIKQNSKSEFIRSENNLGKTYLEGDEFFEAIMKDRLPHYMVAKLFRKRLLLSSGYLDFPHVSAAEDIMSNSLIGTNKPLTVLVDSADYYYRYNAQSYTRDGSTRLLEQVDTLIVMEKKIADWCRDLHYADLMEYQWFSYVMGYIGSVKIGFRVKRQIMKLCKNKIRGWKDNTLCVARYKSGKKARVAFTVYSRFMIFAPLYQGLANTAYKCKCFLSDNI